MDRVPVPEPYDGDDSEDGDDEISREWRGVSRPLKKLRSSCLTQHKLYVQEYMKYRNLRVWYETPVIIFSGMNSVLIAGGSGFIRADIVNIMTCMLALIVGIIQSVRTFLRVDSTAEDCLTTYRDLFSLYRDLSIILDLPISSRLVDPNKYLQDKKAAYDQIMDKAGVLGRFHKGIAIYND